MTNNYRAVFRQLQDIEPTLKSIKPKNGQQRIWHFNACKHLELCMDDIERAEKHEAHQ